MANKARSNSVTGHLRGLLKMNPAFTYKGAKAALDKRFGDKLAPSLFYSVRSGMGLGFRRKRDGAKPSPYQSAFDDLMAVKEFAAKVGGHESAKAALSQLGQLQIQ